MFIGVAVTTLQPLSASIFRKGVVRITIQPALSRLRRCNYRMFARARVLGGVAVRRVVAATRRAAFLTGPQMHPTCADFHTLVTLPALRLFDGRNSLDMGAGWVSHGMVFSSTDAAPGVRRRSRSTPRPRLRPHA